jgi:hypothetical protein
MFSTIGRHLRPSPVGTIAVMALVLAMLGGAYAASGGLTAKEKKQVKAIAKSYQGTGPTGPQGPAGLKGDKGEKGDTGEAGSDGTSATVTSFTGSKGTCTKEQGGLEVTSASSPAYLCNGEPWTAGGTLPSGETEIGVWAADAGSASEIVTASFNIPLTSAPTVEFKPQGFSGEPGDNCPGEVSAPAAKKGFLCFYTEENFGMTYKTEFGFPHTYPSGAAILLTNEGFGVAVGTWAVTAP